MVEEHLIEYYGTECTHCHEMAPDVERVKKELGVNIVKKEVWHDSANQKEFLELASGKCEGVPFFFNKKTGNFICGSANFEKIKEWAQDK